MTQQSLDMEMMFGTVVKKGNMRLVFISCHNGLLKWCCMQCSFIIRILKYALELFASQYVCFLTLIFMKCVKNLNNKSITRLHEAQVVLQSVEVKFYRSGRHLRGYHFYCNYCLFRCSLQENRTNKHATGYEQAYVIWTLLPSIS